MTKEQIQMLRTLIKCEIEVALQNENGYRFVYETEKATNEAWETFIDSFNFNITTT